MATLCKRTLFATLFLLIAIAVPPLGVAALCMLMSRSPRTLHALREVKVGTRKVLRSVARKIRDFVVHKFQQPDTRACIALFSGITVIVLYFLFSHLQIRETDDYLWFMLTQTALTGLLLVSIVGLAWVMFSLGTLFESLFVKVVTSVAISAAILFSRLLAIEFFSAHFPFPASYMPVSFSIATIMLAFAFTSIVFAALTLVFEIGMLLSLSLKDFKKNLFAALAVAIVFGVGYVGAYSASIAVFQGIDPKGQLLLITLAEKYDFTTNHLCEAGDNESVLFIDNVADRAIAATFPKIRQIPPRKISAKSLSDSMPANFHMVRCNPLPPLNSGSQRRLME